VPPSKRRLIDSKTRKFFKSRKIDLQSHCGINDFGMKKDKGNLQHLVLGSCTVKFNLLATILIQLSSSSVLAYDR
jgi:hypothetical protein